MLNPNAVLKLVSWIVSFFVTYGHAEPACAAPGACTPLEQVAITEMQEIRIAAASAEIKVAFDPSETPILAGPTARGRTALLFAAIAAHETGLQPRYWQGDCPPDRCDHGKATGEMQIHVGPYGVQLRGDRWVRPCTSPAEGNVVGSPDWCYTAVDLLSDHTLPPRIALHILRAGGLELYTGQGIEDAAPQWIERVTKKWRIAHPVPVTDAEVFAPSESD